jgi:hypothetical protein
MYVVTMLDDRHPAGNLRTRCIGSEQALARMLNGLAIGDPSTAGSFDSVEMRCLIGVFFVFAGFGEHRLTTTGGANSHVQAGLNAGYPDNGKRYSIDSDFWRCCVQPRPRRRPRGAGRLIGLDSGRPDSHEAYQATRRAAFNGLALALLQSSGDPGRIVLSTGALSLASAEIEIVAM